MISYRTLVAQLQWRYFRLSSVAVWFLSVKLITLVLKSVLLSLNLCQLWATSEWTCLICLTIQLPPDNCENCRHASTPLKSFEPNQTQETLALEGTWEREMKWGSNVLDHRIAYECYSLNFWSNASFTRFYHICVHKFQIFAIKKTNKHL